MATHVKVIAALFFLIAAICLALALFAPVVMGLVAGLVGASGDSDAETVAVFLGLTGLVLSVVMVVLALPYAICGYGLLKLRPWARIMGIIMAAVLLTQIPFGTLIGIYALIVLFQKKTEELFATK